ncbi:MAG: DUF393 domain-containing protein [Thermomicrobiales bacterium]|nr:DUF393 domain-containing protein [Thermomicrobiales bacterium]MCO5225193.1 DUF393 domain-containing protein [Thermomicrobiales bacterium]
MSITLLYDETCGFCTRVVNWVAQRKRGGLIQIMPCQFALLTGQFPVTETDCLTSIQVFTLNQQVPLRKGQAAAQIADVLMDSHWPSRIAGLPIIKQVLDLGYTFIAVNRHRLPGIKQMCAAGNPDGC